MNLKLPSWLTISLGVLAGIVGALNVTTFDFAQPWSQFVTFGAAGLASLGIAPLTHSSLRNALHIQYPAALTIAGMITTACAGVTAISGLDQTWKGVIVGVLTAVAGVLAGPDSGAIPAPPTPSPQPDPAPVTPTPVSNTGSEPSVASTNPTSQTRTKK